MIRQFDCCGIKEFAQIRQFRAPEEALRFFCGQFSWKKSNGEFTGNPLRAGLFFFSSAGKFSPLVTASCGVMVKCPAARLAEFIEEHELGEVSVVPSFVNPNTGRRIFTYLWYPYVRNLRRWWLAQQHRRKPSWGDEMLAELDRLAR
jgi:hypothetical protein